MIGKILAHYEITALIGKGGMGEVYRARDTRLGRDVALKVLPPEAAHDDALRRRLEQEARSVAALHHPNIVTLFAVDEDQERVFLTMELVKGPNLSEIIGDGLETNQLLELALPLTDAIGAAHGKKIVHRDLKPSNVMLDEAGRIKVLDFGLAKRIELSEPAGDTATTTALTHQGTIVGSYSYVSPEQAQSQTVDARSDVFTLGIILYEMASGRRPFEGDNPIAVLSAIMKDPPAACPSLHPRLAQIIERCLQKDPEDRYASATELHRDLVELKRDLDSGEIAPVPGTTSPAKRRVLLRVLLLPVILALGFLGWRLLFPGAPPPTPSTVTPMTNVVVVFPFENLGRTEDAYFAEGMTDEIVSRLTSVPGLGVISRTTAIQYEREGKRLDQIGDDLGVNFVLEGTIRWEHRDGSDRVRITPQLVRVADGMNVWSASYDRDLNDVFAIQSEIADQVVTSIDASLVGRRRPDSPPTTNLDAYDYFLQAKEYTRWGIGPSKSQLDRAEALLDKALALDPKFALAWAHLSIVYSSVFILYDPTEEHLHLAERAANEAVRLQPNLAEGHLARGLYYFRKDRDYPTALEELHMARQLEPGDGEILTWIGIVQKRQGQFAEALETLSQAVRLDPRNPTTLGEMTVVYRVLRDYESALRWADRMVDVSPSLRNQIFRARLFVFWKGDTKPWRAALEAAESPTGRQWAGLLAMEHRFDEAIAALDTTRVDSTIVTQVVNHCLFRARLHGWNGEPDKARAAATRVVPILEGLVGQYWFSNSDLALAYAYEGRRSEAIEQIERARERTSRDALWSSDLPELAAEVYAVLGDTSSAVSLLDESLRTPGGASLAAIEHDPMWDSIRGSAEFQAMLDRHR